MKQIILGLTLVMAVAGTGCALTEAVTPPPPQIGDLPPEAQALFARAVPQCKDPAQVKASFAQQLRVIDLEHTQVQGLMNEEASRWQRRHDYLERELNFYEKEVRRTGGNWQITKVSQKAAAPLKVSTDGAFIDQIKRQREREHNEQQFRHFYRKLHHARARHQKRMGMYQARLDELKQATQACGTLQVTLRKAKEEAALQKNAQAAPALPVLQTQVVPIDALPLDAQSIDTPSLDTPTLGNLSQETLPAEPLLNEEVTGEPEAQTMEQLLALPPAPESPTPEANPPVAAEPVMLQAPSVVENAATPGETTPTIVETTPTIVETTPTVANTLSAVETAAEAQPVAQDVAAEPVPAMAETMEQLLRQPAPQPWTRVAQP